MVAEIHGRDPQAQDERREDPGQRARIPPGVQPHHKRNPHVQAGEHVPPDARKIHELDLPVEHAERLRERHGVLVAKRVHRPDGGNHEVTQQPEKRDDEHAAHHLAESSPRPPNIKKAGDERDVEDVVGVGKFHPPGQRRADEALDRNTRLKMKQPLVERDQRRVAVRGDQKMSGVAPKGIVHEQNHQEWEPVPDDLPIRAHKIPEVGALSVRRRSRPGCDRARFRRCVPGRLPSSSHKVVHQLLRQQQGYRRNDDEHVGRAHVFPAQLAEEDLHGQREQEEHQRHEVF